MGPIIDTFAATLEVLKDDVLVVRFKEEVTLDVDGMREVIAARSALAGGRPRPVLTVLARDQDFHIGVPLTDFAPHVVASTCAEALVSGQEFLRKLGHMYYSHFPMPFPTKVFDNERDAHLWLLAQCDTSA